MPFRKLRNLRGSWWRDSSQEEIFIRQYLRMQMEILRLKLGQPKK